MPRVSGSTDQVHRVYVKPEITRCYWNRTRAWHGAEMELCIETRFVPDKSKVKIEIFESDEGEGSADDAVETVSGEHVIQNNRLTFSHKLEWDEAKLGAEYLDEGGELEFYFRVTIESLKLVGKSNLLFVDLTPFSVSG